MLDYYVRRYGKVVTRNPAKLVKVNLEPAPAQSVTVFTLVLANGRRMEWRGSIPDGELTRLIRIVEGA